MCTFMRRDIFSMASNKVESLRCVPFKWFHDFCFVNEKLNQGGGFEKKSDTMPQFGTRPPLLLNIAPLGYGILQCKPALFVNDVFGG